MKTKTEYVGSGIGFAELLLVVFVVLKLTGVIEWSWWWVVSPIWISIAMLPVIVIFYLLIFSSSIIINKIRLQRWLKSRGKNANKS